MINSQYYGEFQDMATQHMLAPIFFSLVATKAINKGGLFIFNNELYKALVDIAVGDEIIIGDGTGVNDNATPAKTMAEEIGSKVGTGNLTSTEGSYYEEVVGKIRVDDVVYDRKKRTIYCGNMPNATSKTVQTGLDSTNITKILHISGTFQTSSGNTFPIPYVVASSIAGQIGANLDPSTGLLRITTGANYTSYTGVISIEYY